MRKIKYIKKGFNKKSIGRPIKKGQILNPSLILNQTGKNNLQWKGGKFKGTSGYIHIYKPEHPFCNKNGYVPEHHLVIEQSLGRYLTKKERVHHIDNNKLNNELENLHLFKNDYEHLTYHKKVRKLIKQELEAY